eukprot:TRINITY_DN483_c0_g1_i3.p1 TRINITY_DN483_c0_g1~~TRINITY_DN483_c0_g1_i3.p1  ORF type:complete len:389 (-),score=29.57 TRINITY_DN483_c0_g1_i3:25-1191(-)
MHIADRLCIKQIISGCVEYQKSLTVNLEGKEETSYPYIPWGFYFGPYFLHSSDRKDVSQVHRIQEITQSLFRLHEDILPSIDSTVTKASGLEKKLSNLDVRVKEAKVKGKKRTKKRAFFSTLRKKKSTPKQNIKPLPKIPTKQSAESNTHNERPKLSSPELARISSWSPKQWGMVKKELFENQPSRSTGQLIQSPNRRAFPDRGNKCDLLAGRKANFRMDRHERSNSHESKAKPVPPPRTVQSSLRSIPTRTASPPEPPQRVTSLSGSRWRAQSVCQSAPRRSSIQMSKSPPRLQSPAMQFSRSPPRIQSMQFSKSPPGSSHLAPQLPKRNSLENVHNEADKPPSAPKRSDAMSGSPRSRRQRSRTSGPSTGSSCLFKGKSKRSVAQT